MATPLLYKGNICGTASGGGTHANGTVYELNFKSRLLTVLHSFIGAPDGADPIGGLVQDSIGNFYGVAYRGGANNFGTVFEQSLTGEFTLLHSFAGRPSEGIGPAGSLVLDPSGDLFGTTYNGGDTKGWGTVFEYSATVFTTLRTFDPGGALPRAGLHLQEGKLYGTTSGGYGTWYGMYGGTVFEVGVSKPLYTFTGGTEGAQPMGGLIGDSQGNLYGTTAAGGQGSFGLGNGVVFKVNSASGEETVLHTFTGPDGSTPAAGLAWDSQGNLYGTATLGGAYGHGTVFKLDSSGNFTTVHSFTGGSDGAKPYAGLAVDAKGNILGAASAGGSATAPGGYGTLFVISPGTT
jgi:uncharacterized repeat protein (TIGR03803 family)